MKEKGKKNEKSLTAKTYSTKSEIRSRSKIMSDNFIPGFGRKVNAVAVSTGDRMTSRALDYAFSSMLSCDDIIEVPVMVYTERIDNTLVEMVKLNKNQYRYDNWRNLLELNVNRIVEDAQWLPSAEEIESVLGESLSSYGLESASAIAGIYDESLKRRYRDTIATKFIRENWMYHMERYVESAQELGDTLSYDTIRELSREYDRLYVEASRSISTKQNAAVLAQISSLLQSGTGSISEDARRVLSAFTGMINPMTTSSVKFMPVPKYVAINLLAEFGMCRKAPVDVTTSTPFKGDTLIRKVNFAPTTEREVLEVINSASVMDAHEFVIGNVQLRRLGIGFHGLNRFKTGVLDTVKQYAEGDPLFAIQVYRDETFKGVNPAKLSVVANDILHVLWSNYVLELIDRGTMRRDNPLLMRCIINDEESLTLVPQAAAVTSGLDLAYELFSSVNSTILKVFDYDALDKQWHPSYSVYRKVVNDQMAMMRSYDSEEATFALSTLRRQIPLDTQHTFFQPRISGTLEEHYAIDSTTRNSVRPMRWIDKTSGECWKLRMIMRDDVDPSVVLSNLEYLIPEPSSRIMIEQALDPADNDEEMAFERLERSIHKLEVMHIGLPEWAKRLHSLIPMNGASLAIKRELDKYGIPYSEKYWFSEEEFLSDFLKGAVTPGDLKKFGYNIASFVTPVKNTLSPKMFWSIESEPVIIKQYSVPSFSPLSDEDKIVQGMYGTTLIAPPGTLVFDMLPVNYQDDIFVVQPEQLLFAEETYVGRFTNVAKPAELARVMIQPLTAQITADRTGPVTPPASEEPETTNPSTSLTTDTDEAGAGK